LNWSVVNFELSADQLSVFHIFGAGLNSLSHVLSLGFGVKHFANGFILRNAGVHALQIGLLLLLHWCLSPKLDGVFVFALFLFLAGPASEFAHLVLELQLLFGFLLLLEFLGFILVEHDFYFFLLEKDDVLEQNVQVHFDDLRLPHEFDVRKLLLRHFLVCLLPQEHVAALSELLAFFQLVELPLGLELELKSVLAREVFKIFLVLNVNLLEDLLKIFGLDSLHVPFEFLHLFRGEFGQQLDHVSRFGPCVL
jgi:hypothetical protein